ncbi:hypothetical protein [Antarctobacter sp.]|uniref:hypothetical protein n=1 Tax=Antarctobacter sp. TaxID=1872577 RepID=UPI003A8F90E2
MLRSGTIRNFSLFKAASLAVLIFAAGILQGCGSVATGGVDVTRAPVDWVP